MIVFVPGAVIAEWWRERTDVRESIMAGVTVEPVEARLGRAAGEALAARLGATVFTSDVDDLEELRSFFPAVRVLSV